METATEQRRTFVVWLRTGRRFDSASKMPIQVKFNPWHDPANGQFTFAGRGQASGGGSESGARRPKSRSSEDFRPGGSGKGFGGGGAQRGWDAPMGHPASVPRSGGARSGAGDGGASGNRAATVGKAEHQRRSATSHMAAAEDVRGHGERAWRHVSRNGYDYEIDERGRTRQVSGELVLAAVQPRSKSLQRSAGGTDRLPKDDGGHYIARRFNGPKEAFNHFAQDANFNRGRYRVLEDQWAQEKRAGHKVTVNIVPHFRGGSRRPSSLGVRFEIDGKMKNVEIPNEREGGRHGH